MTNNYENIVGQALYAGNQKGIKKFLPLDYRLAIKKGSLVAKAYQEYFNRKKALKAALNDTSPIQNIPDSGVTALKGVRLPYYSELVDFWSNWAEEEISKKKSSENKYRRHLAEANDLLSHEDTRNFALSDELLKIVGKYLGTAPSLSNAGLWWGKKQERYAGSPGFHLDSLDTSCIRIYVYLSAVEEENGPLCVIPRKESNEFVRKTGYLGNTIPDDHVYRVIPKDSLEVLTGTRGSVFAADTTKCLHYGSRCTGGDRIALIFTYASYHNFDDNSKILEQVSLPETPTKLQKLALQHYSHPG